MKCSICKKEIKWYERKGHYIKSTNTRNQYRDSTYYWVEWFHRNCLPKKKKGKDDDDTSNKDYVYSS